MKQNFIFGLILGSTYQNAPFNAVFFYVLMAKANEENRISVHCSFHTKNFLLQNLIINLNSILKTHSIQLRNLNIMTLIPG